MLNGLSTRRTIEHAGVTPPIARSGSLAWRVSLELKAAWKGVRFTIRWATLAETCCTSGRDSSPANLFGKFHAGRRTVKASHAVVLSQVYGKETSNMACPGHDDAS